MSNTLRACQECGRPFYGTADCYYCPECARKKKLDTVVRIRKCQECGAEFYGGPRAKRCQDCARKARREDGRRHRKNGTMRPIGSKDQCQICGKEYIVTSSRKKYCSPECQRIGTLEWQRQHKRGYNQTSGQVAKKQLKRTDVKKVCVYCLREFPGGSPSNVCSDYCREQNRKITQCKADIRRGMHRDLEKYLEMREEYRAQVAAGKASNFDE